MSTEPRHTTISIVTVVGSGAIGSSWSALFLAHGLEVRCYDPSADALARARDQIELLLPKLGADSSAIERLTLTADLDAACLKSDWVQECGPEIVPLKQQLLSEIDAVAPAHAVIASSTSSLRLSEIASECANPSRVIIAHPFNPPHIMPLIELFGAAEATHRAADFFRGLDKAPVTLQREATGHIANRINSAVWRESLYMLEQGIASVAEIDAAMSEGPGLRWALMGPFLTYHLGGGSGGIRHYLDHVGTSHARRWADLGTPVLNDALKQKIIEGVERLTEGREIAELEAQRDALLEEVIALKRQAAATSAD